MSEHHGEGEVFDQEINLPAIVKTGIWLIAIIVVSMILMAYMSGYLKRLGEKRDPLASPLTEANERTLPPTPRLQGAPGSPLGPEAELEHMLAEEQSTLGSYGWVSKEGGIARVPIARAIEILAKKGMPAPAPIATTITLPPPAPIAPDAHVVGH